MQPQLLCQYRCIVVVGKIVVPTDLKANVNSSEGKKQSLRRIEYGMRIPMLSKVLY